MHLKVAYKISEKVENVLNAVILWSLGGIPHETFCSF